MKLEEEEINFLLDDAVNTDYENFLTQYNHSIFQNFESFFGTKQTDKKEIEKLCDQLFLILGNTINNQDYMENYIL